MKEMGSPSPFTPKDYSKPTTTPTASNNKERSHIPFSWEQQPGIPKNPGNHQPTTPKHPDPTLPLPPPLRPHSDPVVSVPRKKRSELGFVSDPFAVALMECSKEKIRSRGEVNCEYWNGPTKAVPTRRAMSDRFGFLGLYSSCKKATCSSVVPSTVYIPRSGRPVAGYSLLKPRPDWKLAN